MLALSIRQPYAELILRGLKTIEYRSRPTRIIGERFYIYAAGKKWTSPVTAGGGAASSGRGKVWSRDLAMPGKGFGGSGGSGGSGGPPAWMLELARMLILCKPGEELPAGVIVGSAVIEKVTPGSSGGGGDTFYEWHLTDVERCKRLRKPRGHPQPVWFEPFEK
jgi:hypothetical protein